MKKSIFLLTLAGIIFFFANTQAVGQLTALSATESLRDKGYAFTGGHWFTEQRTFQKKARGGGYIDIIMGANEKGEEARSFYISLPSSAQDEVKEVVLTAVMSLASARGAKRPDLIEIGTDLLVNFWPKNEMVRGKRLHLGKYGIAITMRDLNKGNIQIEIN